MEIPHEITIVFFFWLTHKLNKLISDCFSLNNISLHREYSVCVGSLAATAHMQDIILAFVVVQILLHLYNLIWTEKTIRRQINSENFYVLQPYYFSIAIRFFLWVFLTIFQQFQLTTPGDTKGGEKLRQLAHHDWKICEYHT